MSVLTGKEIRRAVELGDIKISPFDPTLCNPNSYDFHLGARLLVYKRELIHAKDCPALDGDLRYRYEDGRECAVHCPARDGWALDAHADNPTDEIVIPPKGLVLHPGTLYLGHTVEKIGSTLYVPSMHARSTMGRLGLYLFLNSGMGDLGFYGVWTLELEVVQPLRVYAGDRVGQIVFTQTVGERTMYKGRYGGIDGPQSARLWMDFKTPGVENEIEEASSLSLSLSPQTMPELMATAAATTVSMTATTASVAANDSLWNDRRLLQGEAVLVYHNKPEGEYGETTEAADANAKGVWVFIKSRGNRWYLRDTLVVQGDFVAVTAQADAALSVAVVKLISADLVEIQEVDGQRTTVSRTGAGIHRLARIGSTDEVELTDKVFVWPQQHNATPRIGAVGARTVGGPGGNLVRVALTAPYRHHTYLWYSLSQVRRIVKSAGIISTTMSSTPLWGGHAKDCWNQLPTTQLCIHGCPRMGEDIKGCPRTATDKQAECAQHCSVCLEFIEKHAQLWPSQCWCGKKHGNGSDSGGGSSSCMEFLRGIRANHDVLRTIDVGTRVHTVATHPLLRQYGVVERIDRDHVWVRQNGGSDSVVTHTSYPPSSLLAMAKDQVGVHPVSLFQCACVDAVHTNDWTQCPTARPEILGHQRAALLLYPKLPMWLATVNAARLPVEIEEIDRVNSGMVRVIADDGRATQWWVGAAALQARVERLQHTSACEKDPESDWECIPGCPVMARRRRPRRLLLDAGGVLVEEGDAVEKMQAAVVEAIVQKKCHGLSPKAVELYRSDAAGTVESYWKQVLRPLLWSGKISTQECVARMNKQFVVSMPHNALEAAHRKPVSLPWAIAAMGMDVPTAVLSNYLTSWVQPTLCDIETAVRKVVPDRWPRYYISDALGYVKPEAACYEKTLRLWSNDSAAWDGNPADVLFVDNKQKNLDAAHKVGMATLLADSGGHWVVHLAAILQLGDDTIDVQIASTSSLLKVSH